ncbi:MAG: Spy/CpxP family protein refolding chaperone [Gammaproteobacteria bacterium]|nr:Spy/CpxP family protein refolding chaperone [Gammaproteobacteria bacterium]MDH3464523.1 Spy/CpxP family protein refolding chaperone [Gammaproteobacteria bacterium]
MARIPITQTVLGSAIAMIITILPLTAWTHQGDSGHGSMSRGAFGSMESGHHGMGTGMGMHHGGSGMGMHHGGPGMRSMPGGHMMHHFDFDDEQRKKMNSIMHSAQKKHWTLMGSVIDERAKLRDLYLADTPDAKAIGAVYGRLFDLRRQKIEVDIDADNQRRALLNEEQREQWRQYRRHGPGSMRHGGMMGGSPYPGMGNGFGMLGSGAE